MVERETNPIPTNWVCKADLLACRPDLKEQIEAFDEDELVEYMAEKIGDALQETYWLAIDITLTQFFGIEKPDEPNQSTMQAPK